MPSHPIVWFRPQPTWTAPAGQASGVVAQTPAAPDPVPSTTVCPTLPSSNSAYEFLCGAPGSLMHVARDLAVRGALIGTGIWVYDRFRPTNARRSVTGALADGLAGSAMIEAFVLLWIGATAFPRTTR